MFWLMMDPLYILVIIGAIIGTLAQGYVTSTYNKYRTVRNRQGYTGYDIARKILDDNGLQDVTIGSSKPGLLTDHYDPSKKHVALSQDVYGEASIASVAIAAHEVGHAIQHATGYAFIAVRNAILPLAIVAGQFGMFLLIAGLFMGSFLMKQIGIIAVGIIALFQLITLPVEFNASSRALKILRKNGYLLPEEMPMAQKVLRAAALTYVAALVGSLLNLLYYISLSNNRRR